MQIKHTFTSPKGDGPDSTLVRPSSWNNDHSMQIAQPNKYIGRDKTGAGAAQELPVVPISGTDDGTMWTAAKIAEYVAAQIAAIPSGGGGTTIPLGTIVGSINGNMPGFLPLNGQTFGRAGSSSVYENDLYVNLYAVLWPLTTIIVEGGKGASANADWTAGKSMTLPQSAGTVMGAQGGGLGVPEFFTVVGADTATLSVANLPAHSHTM